MRFIVYFVALLCVTLGQLWACWSFWREHVGRHVRGHRGDLPLDSVPWVDKTGEMRS
jgi:hypothetical protein